MPSALEFVHHLEDIDTGVFLLDLTPDGVPVYKACNARARGDNGDMIGKTAAEVYAGRYGEALHEHFRQAANTGVADSFELQRPADLGGGRFRTTLSPVLHPDGTTKVIIGTVSDITAEAAVRDARVSHDTLNNEIEEFVYFAAHDLRAPLRNISSLAEFLRESFGDDKDERIDMVDLIEDVANRAMWLVSEVLSHAELRSVKPAPTQFKLSEVCEDIFGILDPRHQHELTVSPATIETDRTALQIILRNLVENAIKHGGDDMNSIAISLVPSNPGMVGFRVRDNGKGFPDPTVVFLETGAFRRESGFGALGIRRLISARGGTITASNNRNGSGGSVAFSLPGRIVPRLRIAEGKRLQA